MKYLATFLVAMFSTIALAQKLSVKVVDRRDNETDYSYVVPGHFSSYSNASANCIDNSYSVDCNAHGTTNGFSTPAQAVPYHVRGNAHVAFAGRTGHGSQL